MRLARWHYENLRARWWRELKGWAWLVWHQGWGAVWFYDRWTTAEDASVRPLHLRVGDVIGVSRG